MKKLILFLCLILFNSPAFSQVEPSVTFDPDTKNYIIRYSAQGEEIEVIYEPPTKVKPNIKASVSQKNGMLIYSYQVGNSEEAEQRLFAFALKHQSPISNITVPNDEWSSGEFSWAPVIDWAHTLSNSSGVGTAKTGIEPGSAISGFSFTSSGLPSLVTSYSEGFVKTLRFPYEPPSKINEELKPIREWPNNTVRKKTVGPKDPPDPFNKIAFTDTLSKFLNKSCAELSWITNQGICRSLEAKLDNVERQLERSNTNGATGPLQAFLNEVEAQKDKQLSSEAYALLYFNGQYLLEQITQ